MSTSQIVILNVDDNEGARYAKTRILQNAGFQVAEVANGTDTLAFVKEHHPDLVLLDVKLPDINGIEVCRLIKAEPSSAAILVLQTSAALTQREDRIRGLEGGADNYLVAPIEADELVANVKALLRLRVAQADLRDSEERFRELAENIDDVFWVFSDNKRVLYINSAYEKMWHRSGQDLMKTSDDWLNGVHEDDRGRVNDKFSNVLQDHGYDEEYRIIQPNGLIKWVRDRAYAVKNSSQEVYRIVRITNDISIKKNSEHALREADKNKNTFLATLAHELRNPLASIRSAVSVMHQSGASVEIQTKARGVIIRQVDHLAHLVDDLLDVARISQGKVVLKKTNANLRTIIEAAVETAKPFIDTRRHTLKLFMPDADINLELDPVRIGQSLGNLLHNAAKFTPMGGEITLKVDVLSNLATVSVEDNGIGIHPSKLPQVFELFGQGDVSPDLGRDGLGIGLSLTRTLIELHHGKISVQSAGKGLGSIFSIELPIPTRLEDAEKVVPLASSLNTLHKSLTILIVDDNKDSCEMMAILLQNAGHKTLQAYDAISAIAMVKKNDFDVVISDIDLPNMDGYEFARTLKKDVRLAGARLIALTGFGAPDDIKKAKEAGFSHHFVKPMNIEDLISSLNGS
jgi:PAS domain S-box-containing protein